MGLKWRHYDDGVKSRRFSKILSTQVDGFRRKILKARRHESGTFYKIRQTKVHHNDVMWELISIFEVFGWNTDLYLLSKHYLFGLKLSCPTKYMIVYDFSLVQFFLNSVCPVRISNFSRIRSRIIIYCLFISINLLNNLHSVSTVKNLTVFSFKNGVLFIWNTVLLNCQVKFYHKKLMHLSLSSWNFRLYTDELHVNWNFCLSLVEIEIFS